MNATAKQNKTGLTGRLSRALGIESRSHSAQLEAFMAANPAEYCGFSQDGGVVLSSAALELLRIDTVQDIHDITGALMPADGAALTGLFEKLQNDGYDFNLVVKTADEATTLRVHGQRGSDSTQQSTFDILWFYDISALEADKKKISDALETEKSERQRMQNALDHMGFPAWMKDGDDKIVWCNKAYALWHDTTVAGIIADQRGLSIKKVPTTGVLPEPPGGGRNIINGHVVLAGKRHLVQVIETIMPQDSGVFCTAIDKTGEEDLRQEQKRYSSAHQELLEQLATAVGIFDAGQRLEFYNTAFAQLWQLEDHFLNSCPKLGDLMEKLRENRKLPEQANFRQFKQGWINMFTSLLHPHEDMIYLPDGTALRMLVVPHPMGGLMMTFEDVSSRLELKSSYNTLVAVQKETLDNLTEGVAAYGSDGRLKLWNPSYGKLWNLHPEDLEGEPHINRIIEKMKSRIKPEDWDDVREELMAQCLNRAARDGRLECADGMLIQYSTMPLPDGGVLVTHIDVTDTVRVENALREKNAALETAEKLKLDFLANVSYQLRTPLNAIMGFAEILDNEYFGALNDKQKEYSGGIQEAGERLLSLIDDILDLSTIEAGYLELNKDNVSITEIITTLRDLVHDWVRKQDLYFKLDLPDEDFTIYADPRRIKQILLNLIRNAMTHTPDGGTITLTARKQADGKNALIQVIDTGNGIAPEDQERIFEPFVRAQEKSGKSSNTGAGLGLSLVKNIVEMHKGTITLESIEGQGTTISMLLPTMRKA